MKTPRLVLAALFATSPIFAAPVGPDEHAMTWEQAGLELKDLKHYFNTPSCENRQRAMLGCLFAIEEVAQRLDPPMQIGFNNDVLARIAEVHRREYGDRRKPGTMKLDEDQVPYNFDGPLKLEPASEQTKLAHRVAPAEGESAKAFFRRRNAAIEARLDVFAAHAESRAAITWQTLLGAVLKRYLAQHTPDSQADFAAELINLQLRIGKTPHDQISTDGMAFGPKRDSKALYGVGVQLQVDDDGALRAARVFKGGPADVGGVRNGDRIVSIDGWRWDGDDAPPTARVEKAVEKFLNTEPKELALEVARDGRTLSLLMPRMHVDELRLEHEVLHRGEKDFLYLNLTRFPAGGALCPRLAALAAAQPQAAGWILDLRNNPGGNLTTAICLTGIFLPVGEVLFYEQQADGKYVARMHTPGVRPADPMAVVTGGERPLNPALQVPPMAMQKPMVVLINPRSASASELMAAALQDYGRAWVVGERSFGKGTEQLGEVSASNPHIWSWRDIRTFYRPSKSTIQLNGVQPDFEVFPEKGMTEESADRIREEDMFFNPVVPSDNPPWNNKRSKEIAQIERCLSALPAPAEGADRQLEMGVGVLECDEETRPEARVQRPE